MSATVLSRPDTRSRLADILSDLSVQDGTFAALILLSRIPANLGMPGAAACLLLTGLYAAVRLEQTRQTFSRCWLQLAFPALALLSTVWAVYPAVTLRAAVQMTLTALAGLLLSQSKRPRAVLVGLAVAYIGYAVVSLMAGNTRADGNEGAIALYGLGGEAKNFFSDSAATAALLAVTMLAAKLERRTLAWALVMAVLAMLCMVATVRAHSAGGLASLAAAGTLLGVLLVLRRRTPAVKLGFAVSVIGVFVLCGIFFQPLLAMVQELSAKDAGLTGRGYLWYRADFIIAQRPWFGTGYFGFWTPDNADAIGLWRYFDVRQQGSAFSFHNSYIQATVEMGYVGLAVLILCWVGGVLALLRRFVLTQSLATCFWLSYVALQLCKSPVEQIRPSTLVAPTILLFIGLGFGWFPIAKPGTSNVAARSG